MGIKTAIQGLFTSEKRSINQISGTPVNYTDFQTLWNSWMGGFANKAKVSVTPETSLTLSTYYSCVRNISEDIAKLPFKVFINKAGNRYPNYNHPAYKLLSIRPNDFSTPFTIKETIIQDALNRGNGYGLIERDKDANPINIYWLRNQSVIPFLGTNRKIYYTVNDTQLNISGTYASEDIFHLRGMGNGYMGISVVSYASESIGKAIATQQFGASFFGSTGMKGILKFTGIRDEGKMKQAKESFMRTYEEDGLAATNQAMEFEKVDIPNNEAQFIESQDFNVSDIARWFRMPLSKLQKDSNTGGEQEAIQYVNDCLYPWVKRIEEEIKAKLFKESEKTVLDASFSFDGLLRGDSAAQERRIRTMFATGAWTQNDIRKFMDYNTLKEGGDDTFIPVNILPSDMVREFWAAKNAETNQFTTKSSDSTGSGNVNANVNL